jgi:hypothetical protein
LDFFGFLVCHLVHIKSQNKEGFVSVAISVRSNPTLTGPIVDTSDENIHPVTGSAEHYTLYDWFHKGNCKKPAEVLRRVSLLSNFAGFIESQIVEQLFSSLKNMLKFQNKTTPINHMFLSRLLL